MFGMLIISDVFDVCFACEFLELLSLLRTRFASIMQENHWCGSCSFSLHDCRGQPTANLNDGIQCQIKVVECDTE